MNMLFLKKVNHSREHLPSSEDLLLLRFFRHSTTSHVQKSSGKRTGEHQSTDPNSHMLKHLKKTEHKRVQIIDFKILRQGFSSSFRRKISESLYLKQNQTDLNVQKDSYKLSLFN